MKRRERITKQKFNVMPGFRLTFGYTVFYLSVIVLIPLAALFLKASSLSWHDFWRLATTERALAAYRQKSCHDKLDAFRKRAARDRKSVV